jgi:dTDP-4-amino-4,6-dideoxygalactose transaminase
MPCDLARILPIARAHALPVIEDAACAVGSEILWDGEWQRIGAPHGDIACFSFHPRKVLTVGDGGMLTTNHSEWDQMFRLWRQHGMSVKDFERHQSRRIVLEQYPVCGFNYRLTDLQAAIGRQQLKRLPAIISRRRELAARYHELLSDVEGVVVPVEPAWARTNWQSYCIGLPRGAVQLDVMQQMLDDGIATRRGIMCVHREPAYADMAGHVSLRISEQVQDGCILLPLYSQMDDEIQCTVVEALKAALRRQRIGSKRCADPVEGGV